MNYPVWYLPETGGGLLIALIAILHVFVSHFAVGGRALSDICREEGTA
jgi:hypothetical protein